MGNPLITILGQEVLSDNWYILKKYTFSVRRKDGSVVTQSREAYDRGNGATILLYNRKKGTVLLTRQFRLPTYVNGNDDGMLLEACAGLLDADNPEQAIRRETEEETGYRVREVKRIMELYMSPGSVTEILYFFTGEYEESEKVHEGGGVDGEDIDVLELPFDEAFAMIGRGEIKDAKTVLLLYHAKMHHLFTPAS